MGSYFSLTLDTTPPSIEVYSPSYSIVGMETFFTVVSNEKIGKSNIKIIKDTIEQNVIFEVFSDTNLEGILKFIDHGEFKIVCQVEDEVGNLSQVVEKTFYVFEEVDWKIKTKVKQRKIDQNIKQSSITQKYKQSSITQQYKQSSITQQYKQMNLNSSKKIRKIKQTTFVLETEE